jgi:hypothetical protein
MEMGSMIGETESLSADHLQEVLGMGTWKRVRRERTSKA